jgi:hypothetical protein
VFDPRQRQRIFLLASGSRPALGRTQTPVQWVPGVLSPGVKRGRGVTLTTHPHLVPRLRMSRSYTSSPHKRFHACCGTALLFPELITVILKIEKFAIRSFQRTKSMQQRPPLEVPAFYGTRRFSTVFTRASHWPLPWAAWIQPVPFNTVSLRCIFNSLLLSHLYVYLYPLCTNTEPLAILPLRRRDCDSIKKKVSSWRVVIASWSR